MGGTSGWAEHPQTPFPTPPQGAGEGRQRSHAGACTCRRLKSSTLGCWGGGQGGPGCLQHSWSGYGCAMSYQDPEPQGCFGSAQHCSELCSPPPSPQLPSRLAAGDEPVWDARQGVPLPPIPYWGGAPPRHPASSIARVRVSAGMLRHAPALAARRAGLWQVTPTFPAVGGGGCVAQPGPESRGSWLLHTRLWADELGGTDWASLFRRKPDAFCSFCGCLMMFVEAAAAWHKEEASAGSPAPGWRSA